MLFMAPRRPTLEIHLPISPTPFFFNMVQCFAHSLRRNGGVYRDAPIIVTAGESSIDPELNERLPWLRSNGIELRWASISDFKRLSYFAQGQQRLMYEYASDVVLLMDADMLVAAPFDEVVQSVFDQDVIAGVIAHRSPFEGTDPELTWDDVFDRFGMRTPRLDYEHTGWGYLGNEERGRYCPAYFNYGFVCMPRAFAERIGSIHEETWTRVRETIGGVFDGQIALAAAIARLRLPARALPMRYNLPNNVSIEALHASEVPHASVLHFCGGAQIDKFEIFRSLDSMRAFANAPYPRVVNAKAQRIIRDILPTIAAEQRQTGVVRQMA